MEHNLVIAIVTSIIGVFVIVLGFIFILIKKHERLLQQQQALAQAEIQYQKDLLHTVIHSQEDERRRIGNDLHDQVGVTLAALQMIIEKQSGLNADGTLFVRSKEIIGNVIRDTRRIAHDLSPDISTGDDIQAALGELVSQLNLSGNINIRLHIDDEINYMQAIQQDKAMSVYRVIAELLHNGIRHSKGTRMEISLRSKNNQLELLYHDDGVGIDIPQLLNKKGIGFRNIESRLAMINASWHNESTAGNGFHYRIVIPVEKGTLAGR
jgi:signal transduction histidine kinase